MTCDGLVVFPGTPVSSTNSTDRHDIFEILLKVEVNVLTLTPKRLNENKDFIIMLSSKYAQGGSNLII